MDLLVKTKEICAVHGIRPARSKGQNFLITESIYDEIVDAADVRPGDFILEVGPGLGFLTAKLAEKAERVVAVELDDQLASMLRTATVLHHEKIEIVNANVLDFHDHPVLMRSYKIVANLPYNITSVFLRKFLSRDDRPELMVLMLQREVAERIVASPGEMSLLAASVQFYGEPEIILDVPAENFWPQPEVDSAVIRIKTKKIADIKEKDLFRLIKFGFSSKRKMLKNNLAGGLHISSEEVGKLLEYIGLDNKVRAEDLSMKNWLDLLAATKRNMV